ncbi:MAG: 1-acyl-sn-glycerol-3-phosphate acyltransferase [Ruminococcaceae bacterium]|nr:1-acyl-sn-glycerol-3-phosphate acyltransferase [Oscillospiraceae bacterium]
MKKARLFDFKRFPMDLGRLVCAPLLLIFRMKRLTVDGKPYKGKLKGPAVIVANHTGFVDPFTTGVCFWYRRMYFLASEEVMKGKFRSLLLKGMGCIRIDRTAFDIKAIHQAVDVLKGGRLVSIFPQGQIQSDSAIDHIKSGAALIALQSGAQIVPVYIPKAKHFFSRRVAVIADPIVMDEEMRAGGMRQIDALTSKMRDSMNRCMAACEEMQAATK